MATNLIALAALVAFVGGASDAWNAQVPDVDADLAGATTRSIAVAAVIGVLFPPTGAAMVIGANLAGFGVGYVLGERDDYEG